MLRKIKNIAADLFKRNSSIKSHRIPEYINRKNEDYIPIKADILIIQTINSRPYHIKGISILFATFMRRNNCTLNFFIFADSNELIHYESIDAEHLLDNSYYTINFKDNVKYKGLLHICVSSPNATDTDCVAVWVQNDGNAPGLHLLPHKINGPDEKFHIASLIQSEMPYPGFSIVTRMELSEESRLLRSYFLSKADSGFSSFVESRAINSIAALGFDQIQIEKLYAMNSDGQLVIKEMNETELNINNSWQAILIPAEIKTDQAKHLAKIARRNFKPIFAVAQNFLECSPNSVLEWPSYLDGVLTDVKIKNTRLPQTILNSHLSSMLLELNELYVKRTHPRVSIVTILSGDSEQIKFVIQSYFNQSYEGEIEVIYVDDCVSKIETTVQKEFERYANRPNPSKISYKILHNERNLGNCVSRNRGVAASDGDIVVIIDADCMINRHFIEAHVAAHAYLDCEVVIGPHNIETNDAAPLVKLNELESDPSLALIESDLQDKIFLEGFLNCITRNFSIKKSAITEDLFDPQFSYSLAPDSGFGWEDVEMGYRLYKRGLSIKFNEDAFTVHISHGSSVPEESKPRKSIKNFYKLFVKHPELRDIARRWAARTLSSLNEWSQRVDPRHSINEDLRVLHQLLCDAPELVKPKTIKSRRLRILTYRWHVPHQYELYKTGHEFFLVRGAGSPMCDRWEFGQRPLPSNAKFIDVEDIYESQYDLALLHFDENVLNYENTNGCVGSEWGATFRYFVEKVNLPKIAICHGTPQFYGQFTPDYDKPDLMTVIEPARMALIEYVKDIEIVCNSYQAQLEWGFKKSRVIWHGFDPSEFLPATYSKGILSPLGPLVSSRPHYRGFYVYQSIFTHEFPRAFLPDSLWVPEPDIDYEENVFAIAKYKNYVEQIRKYSVYFNPTLRSPMPRARCEPMMCGVVTVNTNNHDVDLFIKNGVNGFYSNDPEELREYLLYLMRNPDIVRKIGAEARKTAIIVFNHDRYLADWSVLLDSII